MSKIQELINFVNEQCHEHIGQAENSAAISDYENYNFHVEKINKFYELQEFLKAKIPHTSSIYITPADLEGLPQELIDELNLNSSEFKDFALVDVIDSLGGVGSIDKILIELYKKTGEIENRNKLMNRLYRMSGKNLIYSHPTKKGIYSTSQFENQISNTDEPDLSADEDFGDLL